MKQNHIYSTTFALMKKSHNQPIELTLADLVDELEKLDAMPKETVWQMRLAIMHREQESLNQ